MRFFMGVRKLGSGRAGGFWAKGWGDSRKSQRAWQSPNGWRDLSFNRQPWFGRGEPGVAERSEGWWCAGTQELTVAVNK